MSVSAEAPHISLPPLPTDLQGEAYSLSPKMRQHIGTWTLAFCLATSALLPASQVYAEPLSQSALCYDAILPFPEGFPYHLQEEYEITHIKNDIYRLACRPQPKPTPTATPVYRKQFEPIPLEPGVTYEPAVKFKWGLVCTPITLWYKIVNSVTSGELPFPGGRCNPDVGFQPIEEK